MEERLARLEAQVLDVNARLQAKEVEFAQLSQSHTQAHAELQQIKQTGAPNPRGPKYTLIDNRQMIPKEFGEAGGPIGRYGAGMFASGFAN